MEMFQQQISRYRDENKFNLRQRSIVRPWRSPKNSNPDNKGAVRGQNSISEFIFLFDPLHPLGAEASEVMRLVIVNKDRQSPDFVQGRSDLRG